MNSEETAKEYCKERRREEFDDFFTCFEEFDDFVKTRFKHQPDTPRTDIQDRIVLFGIYYNSEVDRVKLWGGKR